MFAWAIVYPHKDRPTIALDTISYTQQDAQQRLAAWRVLHQRGSLAHAHIARVTLTVALAEGEALDRSPADPTIAQE